MEKCKKALIVKIIFILLFASVLFYIRLDRVYDEKINELTDLIPTKGDGFSMKRIQKNVSLAEPSSAFVLSLSPGDTYEGSVLVKNHKKVESHFNLNSHGFKKSKMSIDGELLISPDDKKNMDEEEVSDGDQLTKELEGEDFDEGVDYKVPILDFESSSFNLLPGEWQIIDIEVHVPENTEKGVYENIASLRDDDIVKNNNMNIAYAVGVEFFVDVTDQPQNYQYEDIIEDVNIKDIAKETVIIEGKKILGVGFAFLALYFFYRAFTGKEEKKSKK